MRSFVVGTAGHVDHGKTTLVEALTGVNTDRLPEERRRGMTIELGFAPLPLPGLPDARASLIDVPGHRRLVSTMIAGASGVDLVLLVVAADEGVMPQTREHVTACELLGLKRAVVALTKVDRVDEEVQALAAEEARAVLGDHLRAEIVPCAPLRGIGVEAVRSAVERALREAAARPSAEDTLAPSLWIDRVLRPRGAGTVVTGTLVSGRVARGDRVAIATARGPRACAVRALQVHGAPVAEAHAATRVALNLSLDAEEISRGDRLTSAGDPPLPTSRVDLSVRGFAFRRGAEVTLHVGTASRAGRITRLESLTEGEWLARVVLERPLPLSGGERHLLRGAGPATDAAALGGGVVLDARPLPMKPAQRRALASAVHARDPSRALDALLQALAPRPLQLSALALAVPLGEAARDALARGRILSTADGLSPRATITDLAERARSLVTEHLAGAPLDRGMPLATLRAALARRAGEGAADLAILAARAQKGPNDGGAIAVRDDVVVPAARSTLLPRDIAEGVERSRELLRSAAGHGVSEGRVAEALGVAGGRARAVLSALERDGAAVRAGDLWFSRAVVDQTRAQLVRRLAAGGSLTVIDAKALCALPRRQTILLLEHFDAAGVTRRIGDKRVLATPGGPS